MAANLLIVESPAKAKTIEKILGKDFKVTSCYGHIRDLAKGNDAIDVDNNFEPQYIVPKEKEKVVKELKKLAKDSQEVWLATDEDREGEAISWHLCETLNLDPAATKRIVFHEITKNAIQSAVSSPRFLNLNLVAAQQARRVLDRLVGFEISPILWRKIKGSLSAGRVQSVAVRLIVEREMEIEGFTAESSYRVVAEFTLTDKNGRAAKLQATLARNIKEKGDAEAFLEKCKTAGFTIGDIQVKPAKKSPAAPFTTSTLQQEASRKLGFSVSRTMVVAQRLYEAGNITYMRTDSVNLSQQAINDAETVIKKNYGDDFSNPKQYKNKNDNAQEAHEAIRPTNMQSKGVEGERDEQRLYDLIWKRTLASQMSDAQLERTTVKIDISNDERQLQAKGEVIKFEGFLKVYLESTDDEGEDEDNADLLPPMSVGQELDLAQMTATERFSRPPARYTEAALVKKLEELGIGRPSTYAPIISTIQRRGYVEKEPRDGVERAYQYLLLKAGEIHKETKTEITGADKNKMYPTDIGIIVNDFLLEHFSSILDYNFTANIEEEFDEVAAGKREWTKVIDGFYRPFHEKVEETLETAERASGERALGDDPKTGKPVIARMGKYGPMVQIGHQDDEEKPKFASLRKGQNLRTITMEEAMDLFKLPRDLGLFEEKKVVAAIGRFGPYVRHDSKFVSIKEIDPLDITLDEAIQLIKDKREADAKKFIKEFEGEDIQLLHGRWGPYIKAGKKNVRLPKDIEDPHALTLEECKELIEKAPEKKKRAPKKKA